MRILGVDVGLRVCGFCICEISHRTNGSEILLIREDEIRLSPSQELTQKLEFIFEGLDKEVKKYLPSGIVVEKLYSHYRHPTTLGLLAQVRGVVLLLAERSGINLFEYSPTRARKSFLGRGRGNSWQVKKMAENITGRKFKSIHTADAFSLIVAFSQAQKIKRALSNSL